MMLTPPGRQGKNKLNCKTSAGDAEFLGARNITQTHFMARSVRNLVADSRGDRRGMLFLFRGSISEFLLYSIYPLWLLLPVPHCPNHTVTL